MFVCMYTPVCVHVYVCMHAYICVKAYICIYIHTHTRQVVLICDEYLIGGNVHTYTTHTYIHTYIRQVVLVCDEYLIIGNVGDSRAVLGTARYTYIHTYIHNTCIYVYKTYVSMYACINIHIICTHTHARTHTHTHIYLHTHPLAHRDVKHTAIDLYSH